jgi:FAD/FMN-containing dehydrogenase
MTDALATLRQLLGAEAVLIGEEVGEKHYVDFTGEHALAPVGLVKPRSTDEVAAVLKTCRAHGLEVVIQGGMTGLAGGATPRQGELALSLERMSGVEEIDAASMTLTALAGTPLEVIQRQAREAGFLFPLDLGARGSCTIGGNIATNAGGNEVIRFGMIRNLVLGLEAVLADGTIVRSMGKMLKDNAGYDLKQLFIGTEGTLGVVTRAVLRLFPEMRSKCTALCCVSTFEKVVRLLRSTRETLGSLLSAYEVMWSSYFHYVVDHVDQVRSPFGDAFPFYVLLEAQGSDQAADDALFEKALSRALEEELIEDAAVAQSEKETQAFWAIRDGIGDIAPQMHPAVVLDVSMPTGEMPAFLEDVETEFADRFAKITNLPFGHIGDNNLHLAVGTERSEDLDAVYEIVYRITGEHAGSIAAEHGIGVLKTPYLHHSRNAAEIEVMKRLKRALDPQGILNPGRVIP